MLLLFIFPIPPSIPAAGPPMDEIRDVLRWNLVKPPDETKLQALTSENLHEELLDLDAHAGYYFPQESLLSNSNKKNRTGIGAQLFISDGNVVISPYQGGPAARAGISERSFLLAVDGIATKDIALKDVADLLRGTFGSPVEITVKPITGNGPRRIWLIRENFQPLNVELVQPENHPVLKIREFIPGMTRSALRASIEYIGPDRRPLFIDLRDSTGGDLFEALDTSGLFVSETVPLGGFHCRSGPPLIIRSVNGEKIPGPLVLFVGPDTASAAEAFASALQHHGLAILVGQPTYGKCTTQTEAKLSDGSVLRFTNGIVLTPEGSPCSEAGLVPDIEVSETQLYDLKSLVRQALEK
jgi:carboxyl-terminal processing protease